MNGRFQLLLVALFLFGCGGPADEVAEDEYEEEGYYEDADEGVFDPLVGTIDRAEGVQDAGTDRKSQMDEAIEGSE